MASIEFSLYFIDFKHRRLEARRSQLHVDLVRATRMFRVYRQTDNIFYNEDNTEIGGRIHSTNRRYEKTLVVRRISLSWYH